MTLAECIARHEQATVTPIRRPAAGAITPRGDAALAMYRFLRVLRALGAEDREYITSMLAEELGAAVSAHTDATA